MSERHYNVDYHNVVIFYRIVNIELLYISENPLHMLISLITLNIEFIKAKDIHNYPNSIMVDVKNYDYNVGGHV